MIACCQCRPCVSKPSHQCYFYQMMLLIAMTSLIKAYFRASSASRILQHTSKSSPVSELQSECLTRVQKTSSINHTISRSQGPCQDCQQSGTRAQQPNQSAWPAVTHSMPVALCMSCPAQHEASTPMPLQLHQIPVNPAARSKTASPAATPTPISELPPLKAGPQGYRRPTTLLAGPARCISRRHDGLRVARMVSPPLGPWTAPQRPGPIAHHKRGREPRSSEGLHDGVQVARVAAPHRALQRLRQQARHAARGPVAAAVVAAAVVAAAVRRACRAHARQGFGCPKRLHAAGLGQPRLVQCGRLMTRRLGSSSSSCMGFPACTWRTKSAAAVSCC